MKISASLLSLLVTTAFGQLTPLPMMLPRAAPNPSGNKPIIIRKSTSNDGLYTTNFVQAHPSFRRVNGTLYNIDKSAVWVSHSGVCLEILSSGIVLQIKHTRVTRNGSNFLSSSATYTEIDGPIIFLLNYTGEATTDKKISVRAMRVGTYKHTNGDVYEKWDYGTPNIVAVVQTNSLPKADK